MTAFIWSVIAYLVASSAWLLMLKSGQPIAWGERRIRLLLVVRMALIGWAAYLLWSMR